MIDALLVRSYAAADNCEQDFPAAIIKAVQKGGGEIIVSTKAHHPYSHTVNTYGWNRTLASDLAQAENQLLPSRLALGFSERLVVGLNPGDRLLLFTDGITEASGPNGEEFGKRNSPRLRKPTVEVPIRVEQPGAGASSGRLAP